MTVHALSGTAYLFTVEEASASLFTVADARAFDDAQLASETDYPTQTIIDKEEEIREFFIETCRVDFFPTNHTERHDGDGGDTLFLDWPLPTDVTSLSVDDVALSATEIDETDHDSGVALYEDGRLIRCSGTFTVGKRNVDIVYVAGHPVVPELVKRAALQICVEELVTSNTPWQAEGYDSGGTNYSFGRGDGFRDNWHKLPDVVKAIRLYSRRVPGIA